MKISIITATFNSEKTLEETIQSVINQNYKDKEYIIIDNNSTDGTLETINKYRKNIDVIISEKDKGIYEALNKGIKISKGEIISILNSDDIYYDNNILNSVIEEMKKSEAQVLWGDMVYVNKNDSSDIKRIFKSSVFKEGKFYKGWHPPHPTFFVRKSAYDNFGLFNTDLKISADYELMLRFLEKHKLSSIYLPKYLIKMKLGGKTGKNIFNIGNILRYKWEDYKAWKKNELRPNHLEIFFMKSLPKFFNLRNVD